MRLTRKSSALLVAVQSTEDSYLYNRVLPSVSQYTSSLSRLFLHRTINSFTAATPSHPLTVTRTLCRLAVITRPLFTRVSPLSSVQCPINVCPSNPYSLCYSFVATSILRYDFFTIFVLFKPIPFAPFTHKEFHDSTIDSV